MINTILPPDVEEMVVSYLSPLGNVSTEMLPVPPYPFYVVHKLTGPEDMVTEYDVVSVHAFSTTRTAASDAARASHKKMKQLNAQVSILMHDGSYSSIDKIDVLESPCWEDYGDKAIHRYCARYRIELRVNQTT